MFLFYKTNFTFVTDEKGALKATEDDNINIKILQAWLD